MKTIFLIIFLMLIGFEIGARYEELSKKKGTKSIDWIAMLIVWGGFIILALGIYGVFG